MDDDLVPPQVPLKRLFRLLGLVLTLASLAYLGSTLYRQHDSLLQFPWDTSDLAALAGAITLSTASLFALALCWAIMARDRTDTRNHLAQSIILYANTSILKYLPGNIFHLVGRNVAGHGTGRSHARMAVASIFEIGLSLLSATLLSALVFAFVQAPLSQAMFQGVAFVLVVVVTTIMCRPRFAERVVSLLPKFVSVIWVPHDFPVAMAINLLAFAGFMSAAALLGATMLSEGVAPVAAAAYYLFAWLVGFVIPGAPGGFGVRETLLVMELAPLTGEADALAFALITRLMTIGGDIALYLGGKILAFVLENRAV